MSPSRAAFLQTIFDEGQASCFTESEHGYKVSHGPRADDLYFCINALHPYRDLAPTKDWHSEYQPRRADANVVCFRNFLIELDNVPLEQQTSLVMDKVPVTAATYSGGKSMHFIVSLTEALPSLEAYRETARRLLALFPEADKSCKNPSRLSRLPDVLRPDTGKRQELRYLGSRIPNSELLAILPDLPKPQVYQKSEASNFVPALLIDAVTNPDEAMRRHGLQGRNQLMYWLGKRMDDCDIEPERRLRYTIMAYENLQNTKDFSLEEALAAARAQGDA